MNESEEIVERLDAIEKQLRDVTAGGRNAPSSPERIAEEVAQTIRERGGPGESIDGPSADGSECVEVVESGEYVYLVSVSDGGAVNVQQSFTRS